MMFQAGDALISQAGTLFPEGYIKESREGKFLASFYRHYYFFY